VRTRPFHEAVQPNLSVLPSHIDGVCVSGLIEDDVPRLKQQWLPSAHHAFQT
jgi:hypothetical protein